MSLNRPVVTAVPTDNSSGISASFRATSSMLAQYCEVGFEFVITNKHFVDYCDNVEPGCIVGRPPLVSFKY